MWNTRTPPENIWTQKFGFVLFFLDRFPGSGNYCATYLGVSTANYVFFWVDKWNLANHVKWNPTCFGTYLAWKLCFCWFSIHRWIEARISTPSPYQNNTAFTRAVRKFRSNFTLLFCEISQVLKICLDDCNSCCSLSTCCCKPDCTFGRFPALFSSGMITSCSNSLASGKTFLFGRFFGVELMWIHR